MAQQVADVRVLVNLRASVVELDLHLSYFGDIIQLSLKNFRPKLQECDPLALIKKGVDFCVTQTKRKSINTLISDHF